MTAETRQNDWFVLEESGRNISRETGTLKASVGAAVDTGTIMGAIDIGAVTTAADEGNTGDGDFSATPTVGSEARFGDYLLEIISEDTDAGTFTLQDPEGDLVGEGTVGVAFASDHLNFTLADGAEDFDIGDQFTISVARGSLQYDPLDLSATDGTQRVAGIILQDAPASSSTQAVGVLVGDAAVRREGLTYPSGATDAQKTEIDLELKALGIRVKS